MTQAEQSPREVAGHSDVSLGPRDALRYAAASVQLRLGGLFGPMVAFCRWLESDAFPTALDAGLTEVRLEVDRPGTVRLVGPRPTVLPEPPEGVSPLGRFLRSVGVRKMHMDPRLEWNQVLDLLRLLYAARRGLRMQPSRRPAHCLADRLADERGVQFACTRTWVEDGILSIEYSYCVTCFSRLIAWFERRNRRFADHRSLFHAAPRYSLILGGITALPVVLHAVTGSPWLLLAATMLSVAVVGAAVYLFFMSVGSVEYDNEEKGHRLQVAYEKLDRYAQRLQDDIQRAKSVQRRMLPSPDRMPLAQHVEWACEFSPAVEVGGDYFDVLLLGPVRAALIFADVSGHGMAAAFLTAILRTAFHSWAEEGGSVAEFARRLNGQLCKLIPEDSFAAVFLAVYDAGTRQLQYVNGGHNPEPWLIPSDEGRRVRQLSDARAMLLGVTEDINVVVSQVELQAGDAVVFATDGLVEAQNADGRMFTTERLGRFLDRCRSLSASAVGSSVLEEVREFSHGTEQADDQTILVMRVRDDARSSPETSA